jgi:hypothetical protein
VRHDVGKDVNLIRLFLEGARSVATAIGDQAVGQAWDRPSVLEGQLVSGLAGHVARGGVWVVADFLGAGIPAGPLDLETPAHYVVAVINAASPDAHGASREAEAAIAAVGQDELVSQLVRRLASLEEDLRTTDPSQPVAVTGGKVLRIADYLATRIVEQVVHLDDLARSVGHDLWPYPEEGRDVAIAVGLEAAKLRSGQQAVLRALYRGGFAEGIFPVL